MTWKAEKREATLTDNMGQHMRRCTRDSDSVFLMLIGGLLGHGVALPKNSDIAELQRADFFEMYEIVLRFRNGTLGS
jgi:hypothetical protein